MDPDREALDEQQHGRGDDQRRNRRLLHPRSPAWPVERGDPTTRRLRDSVTGCASAQLVLVSAAGGLRSRLELARRQVRQGREGLSSQSHDVAVAGCRSGDGSAEARSRAAEKLGASARRRRARPRAPTRSHGRTATDDRRVVAALACHRPRSDRLAGPDRGRRVGGARALVRASARVAHPRPHASSSGSWPRSREAWSS